MEDLSRESKVLADYAYEREIQEWCDLRNVTGGAREITLEYLRKEDVKKKVMDYPNYGRF